MAKLVPLGELRFERTRVADQAAAALRTAIGRGQLGNPLPGEHQLARQLGISRPSLRTALVRLASEGLVVIKKGHRSRLVSPRKRRLQDSQPAVCVVCPASPESLYFQEHPVLVEMQAESMARGVRWEVIFEPRLSGTQAGKRLEELVGSRPHVCWVLFAAPGTVQRWFAKRALPTVVVGTCVAEVALPSVDNAHAAVGWHAAGVLVKHRHTRVALVLPTPLLPGDIATRQGFLRYIEQHAKGVTVADWRGPTDLARRRAALTGLLTGPQRPTAVLTMRPALTFAFLLHASALGLRIPQDISILSRDTHPFFEWTVPELTRYSSAAIRIARRAVRMATRLFAGQSVSPKPSLVTPTFLPGTTVARQNPTP